jgi:hypothetical protein
MEQRWPASTPHVRGLEGPVRVLLVHSPSPELKEMAQVLRSFSYTVDVVHSLSTPTTARYDLSIINYDELGQEERELLMAQRSSPEKVKRIALLSKTTCGDDLAKLLEAGVLTNLVSSASDWLTQDLLVTASKLLGQDVFGIEKYFAWSVRPRVFRLNASSACRQVLSEAESYARFIGVHPRLVELFCTVVDEFADNAFYNAPVDSKGERRFAHVDRTSPIALDPGEEIEGKLLSDGRRLGISITDPFGSLEPKLLLEYLARCLGREGAHHSERKGGAGLGFYCVFKSVSHFAVNIRPGKKTEMIGLLDIRGSYQNFLKVGKSFNLFIDRGPEAAQAATPP